MNIKNIKTNIFIVKKWVEEKTPIIVFVETWLYGFENKHISHIIDTTHYNIHASSAMDEANWAIF